MRTRFGGARAGAAVLVLALVGAACGADAPAEEGPARGGTFKIAAAGDIDSFDPGKTTGTMGSLLMRVLVRTLVAYPAVDGETGIEPVADIASSEPAISPDGKRVVISLRPDVKYQPEVAGGRAVQSRDIRYAIERGFYPSVANPYARTYFAGIFVGDEAFLAAPGPDKNIAGIDVSDPARIVFDLKAPVGDLLNRLALPMAAPVPEEYAKQFDVKPVSDYGANVAATGPYQLERSGSTVTGHKPGESITLVRNESWTASSDPIRKAYPDKIEVTEGLDEITRTVDRVLSGEFDYAADIGLPADRAAEILNDDTAKTQLFFNAGNCMRFISFNTTVKPFDQLKVRQAIATLINKGDLLEARGGKRTGDVAGHVLMPGMPGFLEAGGRTYDPFARAVEGSTLVRAQEMMKEAGYTTGQYDPEKKERPVLVVGIDEDFHRRITDIVVKALTDLGIRVDRQDYKASDVSGRFASVPRSNVAVLPNAAWCWLYPDAATVIPPLFDGRKIAPAGNTNFSLLNDPEVNALIDQALAARGKERADLWSRADRLIMDRVPVLPWLWERVPTLISPRVVNFQYLLPTTSLDLAVVAVKQAPAA
ncbi:MAG TPA: ABC transporter substrate-binding protein [Actinomycetota bacterium]|nr:ABC transporter substrate-binding protein [Actinomycetota bacterium]